MHESFNQVIMFQLFVEINSYQFLKLKLNKDTRMQKHAPS